ncbi:MULTISPECIES: PerC family transcriptional regulator [Yersinia]|uniref:PerC family transcriptional regulator n=1 Tax=Yersinia TaxID=629 RepID=UPI00092D2096|nr:PerC family transcriptional regulator [Yersinia pekkanenii]HDL7345232.1 PerC family transcriptional regulator [Yersinia enterocolitica]HDL7927065.1 PerC family transcriptional regulator [Yersinia enterocolitica]HDL7954376.1 PerC family transcriptional regulator [Yersinia enterocolitica]HDL7971688.1 PerC family transcriptional regulator [Yersinia enterocolitica]
MDEQKRKAETLELSGYWRRAATQWLVVMDCSTDESEREKIAQRRDHCLRRSTGTPEDRRREVRNRYRSQERRQTRY